MLQNGAVKVYAVDVGTVSWRGSATDERVVNMERTNIRNVSLDVLEEPIQFFQCGRFVYFAEAHFSLWRRPLPYRMPAAFAW